MASSQSFKLAFAQARQYEGRLPAGKREALATALKVAPEAQLTRGGGARALDPSFPLTP